MSSVSEMYTFPDWSTATPSGKLSVAPVAAPPSPHAGGAEHGVPLPAIVVIPPPIASLRTSLSPQSAMYALPDLSRATPIGYASSALVPAPPSPQLGGVPHGKPAPASGQTEYESA